MTASRASTGGVHHPPRRVLSSAEDLLKDEEVTMKLTHERRAHSIAIPLASVEKRIHQHGHPIEKMPKVFTKSDTSISSFAFNAKPAKIYASSSKCKEFHSIFPKLAEDLLYTGLVLIK
jgi:hypothetical protein